jgi:hypothetical protein
MATKFVIGESVTYSGRSRFYPVTQYDGSFMTFDVFEDAIEAMKGLGAIKLPGNATGGSYEVRAEGHMG